MSTTTISKLKSEILDLKEFIADEVRLFGRMTALAHRVESSLEIKEKELKLLQD